MATPDGRLDDLAGLAERDPGDMLGRIRELPEQVGEAIATAANGRTGSWADQLLLLCYHYDPETGRYTPAIEVILRIAGV